ncbi:MAG: 3-dehydroquinate synthase [bacterium]
MSGPTTLRVELGARAHDVLVGDGAADRTAAAAAGSSRRVALLADRMVARLHGPRVASLVARAGAVIETIELPEGEAAKSLAVVEATCRRLVAGGIERGDAILALGGGATTDAAGFVAAVYLRGVRSFLLPTTLLAQVDAAIGGKTAVDLPEGKNLVGAFHQPALVGCDPRFLATLPERDFRAGLAEIVKAAWIGDLELLAMLELDPPLTAVHPALVEVVRRAILVKAAIVARDERETSGERAALNFGHTLGHAIETESAGRWLHGEAVALGLVAAVHLSAQAGWCGEDVLGRMVSLLTRLGLPVRDPALDPDAVIRRTAVDKKRSGGRDRYQLTKGPGSVSVSLDLPEGASRAAVEFLRR